MDGEELTTRKIDIHDSGSYLGFTNDDGKVSVLDIRQAARPITDMKGSHANVRVYSFSIALLSIRLQRPSVSDRIESGKVCVLLSLPDRLIPSVDGRL